MSFEASTLPGALGRFRVPRCEMDFSLSEQALCKMYTSLDKNTRVLSEQQKGVQENIRRQTEHTSIER